jgi:ribosomal protein L31E
MEIAQILLIAFQMKLEMTINLKIYNRIRRLNKTTKAAKIQSFLELHLMNQTVPDLLETLARNKLKKII